MSRSTSRSEILTQLLSMLETWLWCCMGNPFGPFSEASDRPDGQELGGQENLKELNSNLGSNSASEHARDMVLVTKPRF